MSLGLKRSIRSIVMGAYGNNYTSPSGATLAFHALSYSPSTYEMQDVLTGTGSLTTTHTSTLYAKDYENVYRAFAANEPVYSGGRVVTNWITYSNDMTNAAWTKTTCTVSSAGNINPDGGEAFLIEWGGNSEDRLTNKNAALAGLYDGIFTIWVRAVSGSTTVRMRCSGQASSDITVTEAWQRLAHSREGYAFYHLDTGGIMNNSAGNAGDVYVCYGMAEAADGRSDKATPSEYIPTTTAAVTKIFANANGNSVSSNVVTEATGTVLTETPYLQYYPAATNSCLSSNDQTNGTNWPNAGTGSEAKDAVGVSGETNTACTLTDSDAASSTYWPQNFSSGGATTNVFKVWIKKDADTSRFPAIGWIGNNNIVHINTSTGAASEEGSSGYNHEVIDDGDWWVLLVEHVDNGGSYSVRIWPSRGSSIGVLDTSATGSVIIGNAEVHLNKTIAEVRGLTPIFTTTAAVSTAATQYEFDLANHNDASGVWYAEYYDDGDASMPGGRGIISVKGSRSSVMYSNNSSANLTVRDNTANQANDAMASGAAQKAVSIWDTTEGKMDIGGQIGASLGGAGGTVYSGAFGVSGQITVGLATLHVMRIRNLKRYDTDSWNTATDLGTTLIAS